MKSQILRVQKDVQFGRENPTRTSIFAALMNPDATEGHVVPTLEQMIDEAFVFLGAAADTTGSAMTCATYNVLSNPDIYRKVREEIRSVYPNPHVEMEWVVLARLPYLVCHLSFSTLSTA
jgi:cytochrome P450